MSEESASSSSSGRWWEFYAIRYGVGGVLGGAIVFLLLKNNDSLKSLLFGLGGETINWPQFALFLSFGFAYSYIASAPILVFHVSRFALETKAARLSSSIAKWIMIPSIYFAFVSLLLSDGFVYAGLLDLLSASLICGGIFALLKLGRFHANVMRGSNWSVAIEWVAYIVICVVLIIFALSPMNDDRTMNFLIILLAALVVWPQYILIGMTVNHSRSLFRYYNRLSYKRSRCKGDFVESYRHLREHGNAFFILLTEIILGAILFHSGQIPGAHAEAAQSQSMIYVIVIVFWIAPAVSVWIIGTHLERQFVDDD